MVKKRSGVSRPRRYEPFLRGSAGVFEFCMTFCLVSGGFACTIGDDGVQSANELRNRSFVLGVFRWSAGAAF
jgi:hypothetical protein